MTGNDQQSPKLVLPIFARHRVFAASYQFSDGVAENQPENVLLAQYIYILMSCAQTAAVCDHKRNPKASKKVAKMMRKREKDRQVETCFSGTQKQVFYLHGSSILIEKGVPMQVKRRS